MKMYLATTSKFKREIFQKVGMKHDAIENDFNENSTIENPYELVKYLSKGKAESVLKEISDGIIIGLDTIVYLNDKIYEKPKDINEAKNNLKECSNQTVSVITGITVIDINNDKEYVDYQETLIKFSDITDDDAQYYIDNEPDVMYSSGFIIETIASCFIEKIDGSFYNILGAPVEKIYEIIKILGYQLNDFE